jgi:2-polyprenyl-3-methyl-5-hydroxy-6-metoxy-1,4-benzoquinol methylase
VHRAEKPKTTLPSPLRSAPSVRGAVLEAIAAANIHSPLPSEALDIGSGKGELVGAIRTRFGLRTTACDYTDTLMKDPAQRVDIVDLNADKLPYLDGRFSLVTCIETIARLEQTRPILREIFRVLEPGGLAVISTPNILNLPSRLHYLTTGFFSRFHPLPIRESCNPGGRINPVSYFYLAHALLETGFLDLERRIDCYHRRTWLSWIILFLPMKIVGLFSWLREKNRFRTITPENRALVAAVNSRDLLLGRTLIICARKPM